MLQPLLITKYIFHTNFISCSDWYICCVLLNGITDLQICSVRPVPDKTNPLFEAPGVPEQVIQFHRTNLVDTFQFDRPFHRGEKNKENEFKVRPKKINNMFLRHFFLENDAGGRLFIFCFIERNAIKRCIPVISGKIFDF